MLVWKQWNSLQKEIVSLNINRCFWYKQLESQIIADKILSNSNPTKKKKKRKEEKELEKNVKVGRVQLSGRVQW